MFKLVDTFESKIANFYSSPYAVAVDCCTHAIELCLRYQEIKEASCPNHTYISIPFTLKKLNIQWKFKNIEWKQYYYLGNTNIIDAAVYWKKGGYIDKTFMCLSFQYKKHLSLGRGGAILCNDHRDYLELKKLSYDGRLPNLPWAEQNISSVGFHYYMTPETAKLGLSKLDVAKNTDCKIIDWSNYPDLSQMEVFNV